MEEQQKLENTHADATPMTPSTNNKNLKGYLIIGLFIIVLSVCSYFTVKFLTKSTNDNAKDTGFIMPRVDASLATQPLMDAFYSHFTKTDIKDVKIEYTNTHPAYINLVDNKTDLIIVTEPSAEELDYAKSKGVELEVTPVTNEAFVFFVNKDNKVSNLSIKQIQDIYSGKVTNWSSVGGNNENILAYQRPVNSGSQTGMLSLVMKDIKMKEPITEEYIESMAGIIEVVANYKDNNQGIGYSYYYFASIMYANTNLKFLSINGIEPTYETIQNKTYPLMSAYYIVTRKNDTNKNVSELKEAMLGKTGASIIKSAGYVPVK